MTYKIQTLNSISSSGLALFDPKQYTIGDNITEPDALLVRSCDMHSLEIPSSVQVIGRAGAGTNNIPIDQCTALGIPVLNTPGANANAVKELVITGMLLACRSILPAWQYVQQLSGNNEAFNQSVEKHKKQFSGTELPGKVLGVIGLGKIGVKVANTAVDLGMKVMGYDPAITVKNAWQLSARVQQAAQLAELLKSSDFITVHVPLNDQTHHLLNAENLSLIKSSAILLNFARDEIIDNDALLSSIQQKKIRGYVSDFPNPIFQQHPQVIMLPHLGASTLEAEENCALMIARQVQDFLERGIIQNSVNFPEVDFPTREAYRLTVVNHNIPNMVTQISSALSSVNINIADMVNQSREKIAYTVIDVGSAIPESVIQKIRAIPGVVRVRSLSS